MVYSTRSKKGRDSAVDEVAVFMAKEAAEKVLADVAAAKVLAETFAAGALKGNPLQCSSASTAASAQYQVLQWLVTIVVAPSVRCISSCSLCTVPSGHVVGMQKTL